MFRAFKEPIAFSISGERGLEEFQRIAINKGWHIMAYYDIKLPTLRNLLDVRQILNQIKKTGRSKDCENILCKRETFLRFA